MADQDPKELHDGRFGDQFDDEIGTRGVLVTTAILLGLCALGLVAMWGMQAFVVSDIEAEAPAVSPLIDLNVAERPIEERFPKGAPALQASPEAELVQMRKEQAAELHGYGWIDESTGTVRVPIDVAMGLVLEQGLPARAEAPVETPAPAPETAPPEVQESNPE